MTGEPDDWPAPIETVDDAETSDIVLVCEHAANRIPAEYGRLGLSEADLERHIAFDPGAAPLTRELARRLGAPAFLGTLSRLLVDLNRPFGVPSSMPVLSEATTIPGNVNLPPAEIERRRQRIFEPFHDRIAAALDARARAGRPTRLVTIHSFTPVFLGRRRPWHAGILFERSEAFAARVIRRLSADPALCVAANEPYVCDRAEDYAIPVHGTDRGHDAILVEIRNDLIRDEAGVMDWATRLTDALLASD